MTADADRYVLFVGVETSRSRALAAVPRWTSRLGSPLQVRPVDVSPGAPSDVYRQIVDEQLSDPQVAGAVITGHKVGMYAAAFDRCSYVSPDAQQLRECNVLASRADGLAAYATDVISMGAEVERIWPASVGLVGERERQVGQRRHVVCLGAGGSAAALCLHLLRRPEPPPEIVVCQRDEARADALSGLLSSEARARRVDLRIRAGAHTWDDVVAAAAPGSLVVNATGLGKTDERSPLTGDAVFPPQATVWDLNYRGPQPFVALARAQAEQRTLDVHDGWHLFALGWLAALSALLDVTPPPTTEATFVAIAEAIGR